MASVITITTDGEVLASAMNEEEMLDMAAICSSVASQLMVQAKQVRMANDGEISPEEGGQPPSGSAPKELSAEGEDVGPFGDLVQEKGKSK